MKQLEKYSNFKKLKSDHKLDNFSVEQELKIKDLYIQLQSAAKSEDSSIQKNRKKN